MRQQISAHVDGGLSGVLRVRRHGSKNPHQRERNIQSHLCLLMSLGFSDKNFLTLEAFAVFPAICVHVFVKIILIFCFEFTFIANGSFMRIVFCVF
jgi:hypothetical protein